MKYIVILTFALLMSACSIFGPPTELDETRGWAPQRIYDEASIKMRDRDYETALKYFGKLESRYPNGPYAAQAQLETAYAYYKKGDPVLCVASADRFIKLHPNHPNVDYAYYLKGLAVFSERGIIEKFTKQQISDRDPRALRDAFSTFKDLVNRFPESRYADDARQRMIYLTNNLAEHEIFVARYYMERKAYVAAVNRSKHLIEYYPESAGVEEALIIMISAYDSMDLIDLKNDSIRVLEQNYPENQLLHPTAPKEESAWWEFWKKISI